MIKALRNCLLMLLIVPHFPFLSVSGQTKWISMPTNDVPFVNFGKRIKEPPEVSAWVAWWEEQKAYDLVDRHQNKIHTLSPVWFMVNEKLELEAVGKVDQKTTLVNMKAKSIRILPSLGSNLSGDKLSPFLNNEEKVDTLIKSLTDKIVDLGADGVDVDLEGIRESDRELFNQFLSKLSNSLKDHNLFMAVTVSAQTPIVVWDGVLGQDLRKIGEIADEVRIMTYDYHSSASQPGPVAPLNWIRQVAIYNSLFIDKDKIVMGIPSYGYIWEKNGNAKGLQFYEFTDYINKYVFSSLIDNKSSETIIESEHFIGWLSDSRAMISKIGSLRAVGFNRFIVWHLGGMDEKFFEKDWSN